MEVNLFDCKKEHIKILLFINMDISIFALIPKDVLKLMLTKLDTPSLINFCIASKYVHCECSNVDFRLYYFNEKYGLKFAFENYSVSKFDFCRIAKKYISILKFSESVAPKKSYIDEHKLLHPEINKKCDMCMYVNLNDFESMLKLYIQTYPQLFLTENQNTIERSRLNAKNIIFMFGKAHILTGSSHNIPDEFYNKYSIKKTYFSKYKW